jgi:4-hydroxythreonine-4-phosphate dehydrogenase
MQLPAIVKLVVTTGEPSGIGPEVSLAAAADLLKEQANLEVTLVGCSDLLTVSDRLDPTIRDRLHFHHISLAVPTRSGELNPANAPYVLNTLNFAVDGCLQKQFDAMVTAPLQKSIINLAGTPFTGHTEYLAERCGVKHVVMMLCAELPAGILGMDNTQQLRVALATTHLPLQAVSSALSCDDLFETIQIIDHDLRSKFGITHPQIRVAGLNPHAGESGYLGREELGQIIPAINLARDAGIAVSGPYPGDTMFDVRALDKTDVFLAMYHDQGLAPFKFVSFGSGVNVTLGLPIIRTSVDHGTALDIAGKGLADHRSMLEALRLAYSLASHNNSLI